jgi:hypothetical protein
MKQKWTKSQLSGFAGICTLWGDYKVYSQFSSVWYQTWCTWSKWTWVRPHRSESAWSILLLLHKSLSATSKSVFHYVRLFAFNSFNRLLQFVLPKHVRTSVNINVHIFHAILSYPVFLSLLFHSFLLPNRHFTLKMDFNVLVLSIPIKHEHWESIVFHFVTTCQSYSYVKCITRSRHKKEDTATARDLKILLC